MGCCGSSASKEDPEQQEAKIRLSRANAISSSDAPSRGGGRSAKQRSIAEAAQAQEWCLENLGSELAERRPKQRPRERDKAKAQKRAAAEAAADGVNEHARQLGHLSGAALVERVMADGDGGDCERALAAALVMAERVQRDADEAGALVVGGALNLLLRTHERAEVQRSALATHRCVHALRQILCAAPPELAAARAKQSAWLPRVIAGAMAAHATSGGLAQHASEALTALAAIDAPAVRAAGALDAACAAMRECDDEPEVQLAGGEPHRHPRRRRRQNRRRRRRRRRDRRALPRAEAPRRARAGGDCRVARVPPRPRAARAARRLALWQRRQW